MGLYDELDSLIEKDEKQAIETMPVGNGGLFDDIDAEINTAPIPQVEQPKTFAENHPILNGIKDKTLAIGNKIANSRIIMPQFDNNIGESISGAIHKGNTAFKNTVDYLAQPYKYQFTQPEVDDGIAPLQPMRERWLTPLLHKDSDTSKPNAQFDLYASYNEKNPLPLTEEQKRVQNIINQARYKAPLDNAIIDKNERIKYRLEQEPVSQMSIDFARLFDKFNNNQQQEPQSNGASYLSGMDVDPHLEKLYESELQNLLRSNGLSSVEDITKGSRSFISPITDVFVGSGNILDTVYRLYLGGYYDDRPKSELIKDIKEAYQEGIENSEFERLQEGINQTKIFETLAEWEAISGALKTGATAYKSLKNANNVKTLAKIDGTPQFNPKEFSDKNVAEVTRKALQGEYNRFNSGAVEMQKDYINALKKSAEQQATKGRIANQTATGAIVGMDNDDENRARGALEGALGALAFEGGTNLIGKATEKGVKAINKGVDVVADVTNPKNWSRNLVGEEVERGLGLSRKTTTEFKPKWEYNKPMPNADSLKSAEVQGKINFDDYKGIESHQYQLQGDESQKQITDRSNSTDFVLRGKTRNNAVTPPVISLGGDVATKFEDIAPDIVAKANDKEVQKQVKKEIKQAKVTEELKEIAPNIVEKKTAAEKSRELAKLKKEVGIGGIIKDNEGNIYEVLDNGYIRNVDTNEHSTGSLDKTYEKYEYNPDELVSVEKFEYNPKIIDNSENYAFSKKEVVDAYNNYIKAPTEENKEAYQDAYGTAREEFAELEPKLKEQAEQNKKPKARKTKEKVTKPAEQYQPKNISIKQNKKDAKLFISEKYYTDGNFMIKKEEVGKVTGQGDIEEVNGTKEESYDRVYNWYSTGEEIGKLEPTGRIYNNESVEYKYTDKDGEEKTMHLSKRYNNLFKDYDLYYSSISLNGGTKYAKIKNGNEVVGVVMPTVVKGAIEENFVNVAEENNKKEQEKQAAKEELNGRQLVKYGKDDEYHEQTDPNTGEILYHSNGAALYKASAVKGDNSTISDYRKRENTNLKSIYDAAAGNSVRLKEIGKKLAPNKMKGDIRIFSSGLDKDGKPVYLGINKKYLLDGKNVELYVQSETDNLRAIKMVKDGEYIGLIMPVQLKDADFVEAPRFLKTVKNTKKGVINKSKGETNNGPTTSADERGQRVSKENEDTQRTDESGEKEKAKELRNGRAVITYKLDKKNSYSKYYEQKDAETGEVLYHSDGNAIYKNSHVMADISKIPADKTKEMPDIEKHFKGVENFSVKLKDIGKRHRGEKKEDIRIFTTGMYDNGEPIYIAINKKYLLNGKNVELYTKDKTSILSPVKIVKDGEHVGMVMPMQMKEYNLEDVPRFLTKGKTIDDHIKDFENHTNELYGIAENAEIPYFMQNLYTVVSGTKDINLEAINRFIERGTTVEELLKVLPEEFHQRLNKIKDYKVVNMVTTPNIHGVHFYTTKTIKINLDAVGNNPYKFVETFMHEVEHALQSLYYDKLIMRKNNGIKLTNQELEYIKRFEESTLLNNKIVQFRESPEVKKVVEKFVNATWEMTDAQIQNYLNNMKNIKERDIILEDARCQNQYLELFKEIGARRAGEFYAKGYKNESRTIPRRNKYVYKNNTQRDMGTSSWLRSRHRRKEREAGIDYSLGDNPLYRNLKDIKDSIQPNSTDNQYKTKAKSKVRQWYKGLHQDRYDVDKALNTFVNDTKKVAKKFKVSDKVLRETLPFLRERTELPKNLNRPDIEKFYNSLSKSDKAYLTKLADDISAKMEQYYKNYQDVKGVPDAEGIENHISHIWDLDSKKNNLLTNYIQTSSRFAKERTIKTLVDGIDGITMDNGEVVSFKPKTLDYAEILKTSTDSLIKATHDIKLAAAMRSLKVGENRLVMPANEAPSDWVEITHPALAKCVYKGSADNLPILIKMPVRVHPKIARTLLTVFEQQKKDNAAWKVYDTVNGALKTGQLGISMFHGVALGESFLGNVGLRKLVKILNPARMIKEIATGNYSVYNDPIARQAIGDGLKVGTPLDLNRSGIEELANSLVKQIEKLPLGKFLSLPAKTVAKGIELNNKVLWDYLHTNFKLEAYKMNCEYLKKKNGKLTKQDREEVAQWVNDSFGGQAWELLGIKKSEQKTANRLLLSPDWQVSTIRQFAGAFRGGNTGKIARHFWVKALAYSILLYNALNAFHRERDREKHPEYYPEKMSPIDYTIWANTDKYEPLPNKAMPYIFVGRDKEGKAIYLRLGKQFREVPEMLSNPIEKFSGKASPVLQMTSQVAYGKNLSDFITDKEDAYLNQKIWNGYGKYAKKKTGKDLAIGRLKTAGKMAMPFTVQNTIDEKHTPIGYDLFGQTSKGLSYRKLREKYKQGYEDNHNMEELKHIDDRAKIDGVDNKTIVGADEQGHRDYVEPAIEEVAEVIYQTRSRSKIQKKLEELKQQGYNDKEINYIYKKAYTETVNRVNKENNK